MKQSDVLIMAGAAVAVYLFYNYIDGKRQPQQGIPKPVQQQDFATLFKQWQGWQYFSDGTVIGPDGCYFHNGEKVWCP